MGLPCVVEITTELDLLQCRDVVGQIAQRMHFSIADQVRIVTAVSEIVRNVLEYAKHGRMVVEAIQGGLSICICDDGPGIANIDKALQDGFTTSGGMGIGLGGAKRLMDAFTVRNIPGHGAEVTMSKWH